MFFLTVSGIIVSNFKNGNIQLSQTRHNGNNNEINENQSYLILYRYCTILLVPTLVYNNRVSLETLR